jgi:hypothetical protein
MIARRPVTREIVVQTVAFLAALLGPLILIPVFPHSRVLQAINSSGVCFLILVIFAALFGAAFRWIVFRR